MAETARIAIHTRGPVRISAPDGEDITPRSTKAQGILLLLATSPHGFRTRAWLQDKLWSDRGPQQASNSLRQDLRQIRKAFGPHADVIGANRQKVWLEPERFRVVDDEEAEFAEGIDVRDPEFETWLTEMRVNAPCIARGRQPDPRGRRRAIVIEAGTIAGVSSRPRLVQEFADSVARSLRELFAVAIFRDTAPDERRDAWRVRVSVGRPGREGLLFRLALLGPSGGSEAWTEHCTVVGPESGALMDPEVLRLSNALVEAVGDAILAEGEAHGDADDPDWLCRKAIRALFSMRASRVAEADRLLARAYEIAPRGLFLAWQAQVRTVQRIERHSSDTEALAEEAEELIERALELEPNSSAVLSVVANPSLFLGRDPYRSFLLAERGVTLNAANPMAWFALSSARLYLGETEKSYADAVRGRSLAALYPNRFWWDQQQFGAAMVLGRHGEALQLLRSVRAQNPTFRPAARYQIPLLAQAGRMEEAAHAAEALRTVEPDFSIERMVQDETYPASLIRRSPGLDLTKLQDLS